MTQRSVEMVIGKLVADDEWRELFERDRFAALEFLRQQGLELNAIEIAALEALDPTKFRALARSLDPRLRKASLKPKRSRRGRTGAVLVLLATQVGAVGSARAIDTLTLDDALSIALATNRQLQEAQLELRKDSELIAEARTHRLPTVSLDAMGGRTLTPVGITIPAGSIGNFTGTGPIPAVDTKLEGEPSNSAYVSASVSQPLTQLRKIGLSVRLNQAVQAIDKEKLRAERVAVARQVRGTYYGILQAQSSLAAALQTIEMLRESDRVAGLNVAQEVVLRSEQMQVRAELAAAEARVVTIRNGLIGLKEQMNDLLGRDLATDFDVAPLPELSFDEQTLESMRARALNNRPEVRQARLQVELAEAQRRLKRAESIPDVSLSVSYSSFFGVDLLPRNLAQAGIRMSWEPFDWGRRGRQTAQASLQLEKAKNAVRLVESRVALEVGRDFRALSAARALLEARRLAHEAALERYRVAANRQQEEAILLRHLLEVRAALADADTQFQQAVLEYWTARADLEEAIGEES